MLYSSPSRFRRSSCLIFIAWPKYIINYRAGLTTACYVEYNGVKYSVTRIDTFEGYKQDITLFCKRQ